MKMQTFFKRLVQIIEHQGFKNVNVFALNGLGYDSSSKLNRLRDPKNKPSLEILLDISKHFPDINIHWLVTGKGNMLLYSNESITNKLQEPNEEYLSENYASLRESIMMKDDIIKNLKEKIEFQEKQLEPFLKTIENLELRISNMEKFNELVKLKVKI
ncbi:hypothetical protein [Flavobacterium sp. 316]|uniref:hypothetical protein n=1 Tax=Flavobacterium sp. 316 TaxID=1603293 RepID=UPI000698AD02|nr:hypothetical protein [Flavobacterium sp. 316]